MSDIKGEWIWGGEGLRNAAVSTCWAVAARASSSRPPLRDGNCIIYGSNLFRFPRRLNEEGGREGGKLPQEVLISGLWCGAHVPPRTRIRHHLVVFAIASTTSTHKHAIYTKKSGWLMNWFNFLEMLKELMDAKGTKQKQVRRPHTIYIT